jgi:predicted RNA-binding protein with PIN domain
LKIDAREVPASVVATWAQAFDAVDDATVILLATGLGLNTRGFRAGHVPAAPARQYLRKQLTAATELTEPLREALTPATLAQPFFQVLSTEAIEAALSDWAGAFSHAAVAAALLLDTREAVRALGFALIDQGLPMGAPAADASVSHAPVSGPPDTDAPAADATDPDAPDAVAASPDASARQAAIASLSTTFAPFRARLHALFADEVGQEKVPGKRSAKPEQPVSSNSAAARESAIESAALREARKDAREFRQKFEQAEQARKTASELARTRSEALKAVTTDRDDWQAKFTALNTQFDARLASALAVELDARVRPWLHQAEHLANAVGQAVNDPDTDALMQRAQALLEQQTTDNRRHGLRSALEAEHARLSTMVHRLRTARLDALRPLPGIDTVERQLTQRAARIAAQLGQLDTTGDPDTDEALAGLRERLASLEDLQAIIALRSELPTIVAAGFLARDHLGAAYRLVNEAATRAYDRAGLIDPTKDRRPSRGAEPPVMAFRRLLVSGSRLVLLVDGHNVLHAMPRQFRPYYEGGQPLARARRALEERLAAFGREHPAAEVHLWFDGDQRSEQALHDNVRVHFSGGHGRDRADHAIVAYLTHLRQADSGTPRFLVTEDQDEAAQAREAGAVVIYPEELL